MSIVSEAAAAVPVAEDVNRDANYQWTLEAYQQQGSLWLRWSSSAPFRAQQGQIHVYKSSFPSNPTDNTKTWSWDNENGGGSGWDTKLPWGSGWNIAWIAQRSPNGPYAYLLQLTT